MLFFGWCLLLPLLLPLVTAKQKCSVFFFGGVLKTSVLNKISGSLIRRNDTTTCFKQRTRYEFVCFFFLKKKDSPTRSPLLLVSMGVKWNNCVLRGAHSSWFLCGCPVAIQREVFASSQCLHTPDKWGHLTSCASWFCPVGSRGEGWWGTVGGQLGLANWIGWHEETKREVSFLV